MAFVLTTIKKKMMFTIHTQCNHHCPKTQLGKYSIYPANKCRKQNKQLRESKSAFYFSHLEQPIHISLHIGNSHFLHDDVQILLKSCYFMRSCSRSKHSASQSFLDIFFIPYKNIQT